MAGKFKYNINHLISILPKIQTTEWVASELENEGIPQRTFYRDKAIMLHDDQDIPGERLLTYSKFFGVNLERLFNYTIKIPSSFERMDPAAQKSIKTGLQ